jgi:hypothetical protein
MWWRYMFCLYWQLLWTALLRGWMVWIYEPVLLSEMSMNGRAG